MILVTNAAVAVVCLQVLTVLSTSGCVLEKIPLPAGAAKEINLVDLIVFVV